MNYETTEKMGREKIEQYSKEERIRALMLAIERTGAKIGEYTSKGWPATEYEENLKSLRKELDREVNSS